jgi:hypothetical protein
MFEFPDEKRLVYGDGAHFLGRCKKCCRFVKAPEFMIFNGLGEYIEKENTICSNCGSTSLIFEGFY